MELILFSILFLAGIFMAVRVFNQKKAKQQLNFLENYNFSPALLKRVQKQHDYLTDNDMQKVAKATKEYFIICHMAKGKMVSMPSEIVDVLWHEFILFTRNYENFCQQGLGQFLHHVPTEAMSSKTQEEIGMKRAWRLACEREGINPSSPKKSPLLFAIDKSLNIKGGFSYTLNCQGELVSNSYKGYSIEESIDNSDNKEEETNNNSSSSDSLSNPWGLEFYKNYHAQKNNLPSAMGRGRGGGGGGGCGGCGGE